MHKLEFLEWLRYTDAQAVVLTEWFRCGTKAQAGVFEWLRYRSLCAQSGSGFEPQVGVLRAAQVY
jgi:hypothetical protein